MDSIVKISFLFFLLTAANGQTESGPSKDPEEKSQQVHSNLNKVTREIIKSEMDSFFLRFWETLGQNLTTSNTKTLLKLETLNDKIIQMERTQNELSVNLSRTLNENMDNIHLNLSDAFNKRLSKSEFKMELANFSGLLTGELQRGDLTVEASLRNLSDSVETRLAGIELKLRRKISIVNETNQTTPQPLLPNTNASTTLSSVENQTEISIINLEPPILTEVEEVNFLSGTIEFARGANMHLRTKIWVFQSEGGAVDYFRNFELIENNLGENARLSLWGSAQGNENQHVWKGSQSQSSWRKKRTSVGNVILVTLVISPSASEQPSFQLKFVSPGEKRCLDCSSSLVRSEGPQEVCYPPDDGKMYSPAGYFVAVIAPPSGETFGLTLKYLNLRGSRGFGRPQCSIDHLTVWFLDESPNRVTYQQLSPDSYTRCGKIGELSEPLGNSTVAILQFHSSPVYFGKGFRIDMDSVSP